MTSQDKATEILKKFKIDKNKPPHLYDSIFDAVRTAYKESYHSWISCEYQPLVTFIEGSTSKWETTFACDTNFMAAVPTNHGWWIHQCYISEYGTLYICGDDDNEPAGWEATDITHYFFIEPPYKLTNNETTNISNK